MRIYYINLDHDQDRRDRIDAQLGKLGLTATRIRATTPDDVTPELVARHCDPSKLDHVTPGELACTLSHRGLWQRLLDEGEPHALILEDDILLSPRLPAFLARADRAVRRFGLIHIEAHTRLIRIGTPLARIGKVGLHRTYSFNYGTGGYILTADVARRLLGGLADLDYCVDNILFDPARPSCRKLRPMQAVPALVANGSVMADLTGEANASHLRDARLERVARWVAERKAQDAASIWSSPPLRPRHMKGQQLVAGLRSFIDTRILRIESMRMSVLGLKPKSAKRRPPSSAA